MAKNKFTGFLGKCFPKELWSRRFTVAFLGSLLTVLLFDLFWSFTTSYRGLGFVTTYIYAALMSMLMALPAFCRRGRWWMALVLVMFDLLFISNLMYARTYFYPIPPASYLLVGNVAEFGDAILNSLRWYDFLFFPVTILTVWLMGGPKATPAKAARPYLTTLGSTAVLAALCIFFYGSPMSHIRKLKEEVYHRATPPVAYTLPMSILSDLLESNAPLSEARKAEAVAWVERHNRENLAALNAPLASGLTRQDSVAPRRIVLFIVESLEAWPIGKSLEGQVITPNLNRFVADTAKVLYAPRVMTQVGSGRSIDGQLLITAGMLPTQDHVYSMRFPDHSYPHLLQSFKARYPEAEAVVLGGDRTTTWNQGAVEKSFGFDRQLFRQTWDCSESFGHPRNPSDGSLFRQITEKLENNEIAPAGEPSFMEIITYSSHFPFRIPPKHRTIDIKDDYYGHFAQYVTSVNYVDRVLGEFIDYLLSRPDGDQTMIVITGDHDGLISERYTLRDQSKELAELIDGELYLPLIVINSPVTGTIESPMGQVDIYTTLLDAASLLPDAKFTGMGTSAIRSTFVPYSSYKPYPHTTSAHLIRANLLHPLLHP